MMIQNVNVSNLMTYMMNQVACTMEYNWGNDFKHEELSRFYEVVQGHVKNIDFNKLTNEEMLFLGFRKFKSEDEGFLVPIWLLRALPEGTKVKSIMDKILIVGEDKLDNDVRMGCTAYMLIQDKK